MRAIDGVLNCAEVLRSEAGHVIPMNLNAASMGRIAFTQREPIGVVVAVSAFNHPLNLIVNQVGPAIAAYRSRSSGSGWGETVWGSDPSLSFGLRRFAAVDSPLSPLTHGRQNGQQRLAFRAKRIVHARRYLGKNFARDERVTFQFAQLGRQHPLRRCRNESPQFAKPACAIFEMEKDRHFVFATDHFERRIDGGHVTGARVFATCGGWPRVIGIIFDTTCHNCAYLRRLLLS
jgi:hypothetical protein